MIALVKMFKVELDLSNYETKADLKEATGVDMSNLTAKFNLTSLNVEADKIDIGNQKAVFVDLSKLSNAVNNEVFIKTWLS